MTDVIEIPLIAEDQDLILSFLKLLPVQGESIYNGFIFYNYPVAENKQIYFYILEPYQEMENAHIWESIIPKAPISLMFFSWDQKVQNTGLAHLHNLYTSKFSTPIIFISDNIPEELDFSSVDDDILQKHLENIMMYQPDTPKSAHDTLLNALKNVRENIHVEMEDK